MERLTTRIENYVFVSDEHKAIERLAVYEDTGLTPEQIIAMDEEYTKLAKELGEYKRLEEQGRLIDADEFKKRFGYGDADSEEEKLINMTVRRMINSQPTAYDVEAVVKELSKASFVVIDDYYEEENDVVFLEEAIEIVRNGGVK